MENSTQNEGSEAQLNHDKALRLSEVPVSKLFKEVLDRLQCYPDGSKVADTLASFQKQL